MKTETKKIAIEKDFDTVKTFRAIEDKMSMEMADMKINSEKLYS